MYLDDTPDDRQAEADAGVIGTDAPGAPLEELGQRRDHGCSERLTGVLDRQRGPAVPNAGHYPYRAAVRQVVHDRVVHEIHDHLLQKRSRADRRGCAAGCFDGDAASLAKRQQRLGHLFGDQRQIHWHSLEGPRLGATQQQQRLGELDGSRVDPLKALDQLVDVAVGILTRHLEQRPRNGERGAQLV